MHKYVCEECGGTFYKEELSPESFAEGEYYCLSCDSFLAESGWDAVDPDHNFDSFNDWDERGH